MILNYQVQRIVKLLKGHIKYTIVILTIIKFIFL